MDNGGAFTQRLFDLAELSKATSALDIGCGPGDVTLRLARHLGDSARVLGVDLNAKAILKGSERARNEGVDNATFETGDLRDLVGTVARFDVITCRRVLMYLPNQIAILKTIHGLLKPGGCFLIQEHDASVFEASADLPLHRQARSWIWDTVAAEGANVQTGFALHGLLKAAGFDRLDIFAEAIVETPSQSAQTAAIVEVMMPRIEAAGIATASEIKVETLGERLLAERQESGATMIGEMMFGAVAYA